MRLIDADALKNLAEKVACCGLIDLDVLKIMIDHAPTIDAVPRWIPCEERLPEPNVAVLGYAPAFDNIFAVYYDSVLGWMTWDPVHNNPFPSFQGEIVAWMPLPEPYKGERRDDDKSCGTCKHRDKGWYDASCDGCTKAYSNWERRDDE